MAGHTLCVDAIDFRAGGAATELLRKIFLVAEPNLDAALDDAVLDDDTDIKEVDVADEDSDEDDDCDPRLLRRSSLLPSTKSCNVFLLSTCAAVGGLLLDLDNDDTLATLLAILLMLLLLFVLFRPLLPSAVKRARTDAE